MQGKSNYYVAYVPQMGTPLTLPVRPPIIAVVFFGHLQA